MEQRINAFAKGQAAMKSLYGLGMYLAKPPIEQRLSAPPQALTSPASMLYPRNSI